MMPVYHTEIDGEKEVLACLHWRMFPPWAKDDHIGKMAVDLWKNGTLDGAEFQRAQVWEKRCGKYAMDEGCKTCKMVRKIIIEDHKPVMVALDDPYDSLPITDVPTLDSLPRHRSHLFQQGHFRGSRVGGKK